MYHSLITLSYRALIVYGILRKVNKESYPSLYFYLINDRTMSKESDLDYAIIIGRSKEVSDIAVPANAT